MTPQGATMMQTAPVLVPLDGSAFSEQAISVACSIAERWHAPLRLARVHLPLASEVHCADGLVVVDDQRDFEARLRDAAYLEERREVGGEAGIETVLLQGPAVSAALAFDAQQSGARLVVMTTHGRGGLSRLLMGSVATGVVQRSPAPVLLLRPGRVDAPRRFRRILVPLDGGDLARSILSHVERLAEPGARFVLLTVVEPASWAWPDAAGVAMPDVRQQVEAAQATLDEQAEGLRARGFDVESRVCVGRHCAQEILAVAGAIDAELIALATHGRSGLARAALGSVADEVVRGTHVPVLLHHPSGRPADRREGETR
jgi:nucleotide-binding universal stress UspA family protein